MKSKRSELVVAFVGLGRMGAAMAARLLVAPPAAGLLPGKTSAKARKAKVALRVWNRTAKRAEPLKKLGAFVAATPKECAMGADIVITMLADKDALAEVMIGHDGLLSGLSKGALVVDMSTIGRA